MVGKGMLSAKKQKMRDLLLAHTRAIEPVLWKKEANNAVRCFACGHRCLIYEGLDGICKVRTNQDGKLLVPWNYVGGLNADPIEKKPFFHALPGSKALSFGMLGCDFHCAYCQNWFTSQTMRDEAAGSPPQEMTAQDLVKLALVSGSKVMTSTYNEPLITSEWAVEVFKQAKSKGLRTSYVSNGNATKEVLEFIRPHVDFYKIDLKSFSDKHYRQLGGVLDVVLNAIQMVHQMGFWMEIVTLVIPGFNDSEDEIKKLCDFLVGVSPDIPWHATAFHEDYKMTGNGNTTPERLVRLGEIGKAAGLKYVYLGNLPGQLGEWENTMCPECGETLIRRYGFRIIENKMSNGTCFKCSTKIPGVWN